MLSGKAAEIEKQIEEKEVLLLQRRLEQLGDKRPQPIRMYPKLLAAKEPLLAHDELHPYGGAGLPRRWDIKA